MVKAYPIKAKRRPEQPIPKGLNPPAQGWCAEHLPWVTSNKDIHNPERVVAQPGTANDSTLTGLDRFVGRLPSVATGSQRWAEGWNPFGIRTPAHTDGGQRTARPTQSLARVPFILFLTLLSAFLATAQTNAPPASYVRSYVNDLPDQPLVTVSVTGAVGVACFAIEEVLPLAQM